MTHFRESLKKKRQIEEPTTIATASGDASIIFAARFDYRATTLLGAASADRTQDRGGLQPRQAGDERHGFQTKCRQELSAEALPRCRGINVSSSMPSQPLTGLSRLGAGSE